QHKTEIALLALMQMPIGCIRPRIERLHQAEVAEHPHHQHAAVDTSAFDVGAVMIRRADPTARFAYNAIAVARRGGNRGALTDFVAHGLNRELRRPSIRGHRRDGRWSPELSCRTATGKPR